MKIMVQVKMMIKEENSANVEKLLTMAAQKARTHIGCEFFHVLKDQQDTQTFYLSELWESAEALANHELKAKELIQELQTLALKVEVWKNEVMA